ncbi:unnamed protein product [Ectocarpus sp. 8 AP-2014]
MGYDDRHRRSSDRERARGEHVDSRSGHPSGSSRHGDRDDRRGASDRRSGRKASKRSRSRSCSRSRSSSSDHQRRRRERGHSRSRSRERSHERSRRKSRWGNHERRQQDAPESEDEGDKIAEEEEDAAEPLPVTLFKDELMKAVRGSQVLVCTGETGSGKTTQIPQYLLELVRERDADTTASGGKDKDKDEGVALDTPAPGDGKRPSHNKKLLVAVTQPRRVAATSVAKRVADERGCRLGEEVGYSIRFEDRTGPRTRIKYMTDGVLVRECLEDPYLSRYGVVMLDEAHERSIDTDILFGLLKRALARRPDLRAVITSATLDVERFAAFFDGCPFINVPGRTHAVDVYHSKTRQVMTATGPASPRYVEDAVDIIRKVHRTQGPGHVLAFFTGQDEIERASCLLSEAVAQEKIDRRAMGIEEEADNGVSEMIVVPLFGALSAEAQADAFKSARAGVRKVVMATNIAETSVTVPGVRFVVDPGYVKQKTYDPARRMESLVVVPISQVAAQQRAGRAGRTAPGQCYRLYTRNCYGGMLGETVPEILRTNLANTLLYLKVLGVDDILAFDFLDPPAEDQSLEALQHLYCLGALDQDGRATDTGRHMSRFPLEPSLSRTLLEAGELGCLEEILTIVALLSVESIWFTRSKGGGGGGGGGAGNGARGKRGERDEEAEASHALFRHPLGDHFTYLAVYRAWEASGFSDAWAKEEFLRVRALRTARSVRSQLLGEVRKASGGGRRRGRQGGGLEVTSCGRDLDKVRKAVCAGYFTNAGQRCSKEWVYRSLAVGALQQEGDDGAGRSGLTLMYLHPTSSLVHAQEPPEHVVYTELVFTARPFMRHAMAVKGRWLRSRLEAVRPCSSDRLCGRALAAAPGAGGGEEEEEAAAAAAAAAGAAGRTAEASSLAKKNDAIEAARARFLARKRTKG